MSAEHALFHARWLGLLSRLIGDEVFEHKLAFTPVQWATAIVAFDGTVE